MGQESNLTADIWEVPSSPPAPADTAAGNNDAIEESITASAFSLPSASMDLFTSKSNTSESDSANINAVSPASSSSSLSEPPTEPNSPNLFHVNAFNIKREAAEDTIFDIASEVAEYSPPASPTMTKTPSSRGTQARSGADRRSDPCADEEWVVALRVAHAADKMTSSPDDPTTTHFRNLRRTSDRLNRTNNPLSSSGYPIYSPSPNRVLTASNKRGRSSLGSQLNSIPSDGLVAIKKEMLNERDGIGIDDSISSNSPVEKKKTGRPPGKKQKVDFALKPTSKQRDSHAGNREGNTIITLDERTSPGKGRRKYTKKSNFTYVTEELDKDESDEETRGSVPPNFTFRYAIPHTPLKLVKEPLRSSRYWSEGAEDPGNLKPIGGVFQRKDGLLTDVVYITESRLRPRKLTCNTLLGSPKPRKPKQPRESLNPGKDLGSVLEAGATLDQPTKKRAFGEKDVKTEESSNDDDILVTEDEDHENNSSDTSESTDEEGEEFEEDDEMCDGLGPNDEDISLTVKTEDDHSSTKGPLKRQKLNSGEISSPSATRKIRKYKKKKNQSVTNREDIDDRVWPGAISFVDGKFKVPRTCENCKDIRQFCDRNLPCAACTRRGKNCERQPGLQLAKRHALRPRKKASEIAYDTDDSDSADTLESPQLLLKPRPRGRPPKSGVWAKKEVMNRVKKERDTKEITVINLVDPQEGKPPGIRKPDVWCESRQELCESLPYYRSYQSGCYGHDGLVHGYLLDGFAAPRDYVDGKVVISHSGGKSAADEDGQRRLLTNQTSDDKVIKYLLANMKNQLPLVMIMGTQCSSSPSKLPHRYCVMDWFKVTAGWAERDPRSRYTRWKFRFEKLDTTIDGWWAAAPAVEYDTPTEMVKASCSFCKSESPHVYEEGWMCLKPECVRFWTLNGKDAPTDVKYTENFLRCRTQWPTEFLTPPSPLGPPLNFNRDVFFDGGDVSRVFWKGMCCPKCGRLNCREVWAGWRCLSCDFKLDPPRTIFDATRLADPHRPVFTGPAIPANICHDDITYERYVRDGMTVIQYQLGDCGTVTHILANQKSNARPRDADWLFQEYQSAEMPFKRFILGNHKAQGRLLTQQFTFNCGAPYKFIVDVESYPFDKSPPVVSRALEVIHDRVNLVHPEAQFNEVLNVGYFEKQKMDYHDDGEEGLGETVASISLGAPARMRFRVKTRYAKDRHCWTTRPATPPQCRLNGFHVKEEPRNDENLELVDDDEDEDLERNEDVIGGQQPPSPPGRGPKKLSKGRVKLDLCLSHGDVMVMKGRDIQKYWEHSVIPQGLFRIAATARFISERHPGVFNKIKAEAGKSPRKPAGKEQQLPTNKIAKLSPAEEHNAGQNEQPPEPQTEERRGSKIPLNPALKLPMPFTTDRSQYRIPGLSKDDRGMMISGLQYNHPLYATRIGVMPSPNTEPHLHGDANMTRNQFYNSTLTLYPSNNTSTPPTQRLPRFASADILHPTGQPVNLNYSLPFPSLISQPFSANTQQVQSSGSQGVVLPSLEEALAFKMPSSLEPAEHFRMAPMQMGPTRIADNCSTNGFPQQEPVQQRIPSNTSRNTEVGGWNSKQTVSSMPTATRSEHRIPGLTTLWPEMGDIEAPAEKNSEVLDETNQL